ncbi:DUF1475 family protein [Verrucomicrobium spinosum]|uniref:DUF1475 family protein n=1 Tax=Verrucomicrobium spinosum TaxID=2736 RepID=UPI00017448BC|nr:DUF1475 family protein [Verrucomicrobium spinosum]
MKAVPFLRVFFIVVLVSMLSVTIWASTQCALWKVPREVATHPWFIATLFDAYWGFLTFYIWVFYLERRILARVLWLVAILLLGNIAMAVYALIRLIRLPADATLETLLTKRV